MKLCSWCYSVAVYASIEVCSQRYSLWKLQVVYISVSSVDKPPKWRQMWIDENYNLYWGKNYKALDSRSISWYFIIKISKLFFYHFEQNKNPEHSDGSVAAAEMYSPAPECCCLWEPVLSNWAETAPDSPRCDWRNMSYSSKQADTYWLAKILWPI